MKVNVLLVTYNQEEFVEEAVMSIAKQEKPWDYEVIVADDYSSDGTIEIITTLLNKHKINYRILETRKNYGISYNYKRSFSACNADYIAVLEGDDYWTDNQRLIKHVNYLDNNPNVVLTSNRFWRLYEDKRIKVDENDFFDENDFIFNTKELVLRNYLSNLSTCVFRKSALNKLKPDIYDLGVADWMLGMALGEFGNIAKLNELMSVFRIHKKGSWNGKSHIDNINRLLKSTIPKYNRYLGYRYDKEFKQLTKQLRKDKLIIVAGSILPNFIKNFIKKLLFVITGKKI